MYELGYCYPYDSNIFWDGRDTELNRHWFNIVNFTYKELKDYEELREGDNLQFSLNSNIILNPQILQIYMIDNTSLCIVKTLWLKIFQRKYRNYYNKKLSYYKNPKNLLKREIYGSF